MNLIKIEKKTIVRVFFCILGCIAFYWLLHETDRVKAVWKTVSGIFSPFVLGGVLAFILNVPMRAIENWVKFIRSDILRRLLSITLTMVMILLVIVGVIMLLVPQIEQTLALLFSQLPGFFDRVYVSTMEFLEERPELMAWVNERINLQEMNWSSILEKATEWMGSGLKTIFNSAVSAVTGVFGVAFNTVVGIVFAFYCLARKETLARQGRKVIYAIVSEKFADEVVRILRMTNSTFSNFLAGQCLEALILGLLFVPAMAIARMPYIPLICVLIAVTALVPVVGAFVGCALGAFFILVSNPMQAVVFVIMFLAIQQFEGNVIYPRVVGGSIGLPGMWVLLAVAIGGGLMGVVGMFLMVPLASVIYTLIREKTQKALDKRSVAPEKLREQPPELESRFRSKRIEWKAKRQERRDGRMSKKGSSSAPQEEEK